MPFYEIYVNEIRYQKSTPLTYSSTEDIEEGGIVSVPYGTKTVMGFTVNRVKKPKFTVKPIEKILDYKIPAELIKLHDWMLNYYPYGSGATTRLFLPNIKGLNKQNDKELGPNQTKNNIVPNEDQSKVLQLITKSDQNSFLLHGETGSGKTFIYEELVKICISSNRSAIILVPEISLINQTKQAFEKRFNDSVVTIHSELTTKEHSANWSSCLTTNKPLIVVGTRSAIFAPIKNIGLIVVDEAHEPTYKQDSLPRYNALRVAAMRSSISEAKIVYGSATPSVSEYYLAIKHNAPILTMKSLADGRDTVTKHVIDFKNKKLFSKHHYISDKLVESIRTRLARNEQSLLLLNRRGTAKQILCRNCGWQSLCPKCELPLTLHADSNTSRCHTCGHSQKPTYSCPKCNSLDISYQSLGTKALVDAVQDIFPEAKIKRFDTDNKSQDKLIHNFESVKSGATDIIIGTQMIGKGLDLPRLGLAGIINADISLSLPDFSSAERNYQIIHQAIGRVGRGHINGEVIVQTYRPDDHLIQAAVQQKWTQLYESEIKEREKFNFPPFCFLMKISASRKSSKSAQDYLEKIRNNILEIDPSINISPPTPSFYEKSHGNYNWQLVVKSRQRTRLTTIAKLVSTGNHIIDIDPLNLL